jgi:hypothetical protein
MDWFLVFALTATVFCLLGWGMLRRDHIYQFPFLVGVITASFILPQVPALANDRFLPIGAFARTIAFLIVCLFMCWLGWNKRAKPLSFFRLDFDERRLLVVAAVLSVIGSYFYYALSRLPGDLTIAVQMTGVPVIYVFFSRLMCYGLALALLCAARRPSWPSILIILFDLVFYLDRIVITGKRAEALELIMMIVLALYFYRGITVPRWLILIGVVLGPLLMNSMGDYRSITKANSGPILEEIENIDFVGNLSDVFKDGGNEVTNAILIINNTATTMEFDYGKSHWNHLVFGYVPAQLVGAKLKEELMLPMPSSARDYNPVLGTTETGLADAFESFWYFGALKFLFLAYVMSRLWVTAKRGEVAAQFTYMLSIVPSMHAISHQTDWVVSAWVHMLLFAVPMLALAIVPARRPDGAWGSETAHSIDKKGPHHAVAL